MASKEFEPVTSAIPVGAMLYQLSYEATHRGRGQFIEFISSGEEWNDLKYIIISFILHIISLLMGRYEFNKLTSLPNFDSNTVIF